MNFQLRKAVLTPLFLLFTISLFAQQNVAPGECLVMLQPKTDAATFVKALATNYGSYNFQLKKEIAPSLNVIAIGFNTQYATNEVLKLIKAQDQVVVAQANHTGVEQRVVPNDADYSSQWAVGSSVVGRMYAPEAWEYTTGGTTALGDEIIIAIIDGGFDLDHEDVEYYQNPNEIAGDGIDNDNNGYIDDVSGWNAYNSNGTISSDYHGQHVAGIAGAKGNNGYGVAGVNWDAKILPIAGSSGYESIVLEAYGYVHALRKKYNTTNGAEGAFVVVTNSSFGIDLGDPANYPLWCAFYDSLGVQGIISCGATANANYNIDTQGDVPTACSSDYLIAVTNTQLDGTKINGAGYGATTIDLGAPGTSIYSTLPNDNYGSLTGTSMATPQVAGAVALMYAGMCQKRLDDFSGNPGDLALAVRDSIIEHGTSAFSSLDGITVSGGILNLQKCIEAIRNYDCIDAVAVEEIFDTCGACNGGVRISPEYGTAPYAYTWNDSLAQTDSLATLLCIGEYVVTITDDEGFTGVDTFTVSGNSAITASAIVTETSPSTPNGSIDLTISGGSGSYSISWDNGDTGEPIDQLAAGTYVATITDDNGCSDTFSFVVETSTGINSLSKEDVRLYPMPFSNSFTVSADENIQEIRIYSITGKLVDVQLVNNNNTTVNTSAYPAGTYIIEIKGSSSNLIQKAVKY